MIRFLLYSSLLTVLFWIVLIVGQSLSWWDSLPSYSLVILLSQWIGVLLVLSVLNKSMGQPARFTSEYLLSIVLKLIVFGGLILAIIFIDREGASKNALLFIISYFVFTALEVSLLFRKLKS